MEQNKVESLIELSGIFIPGILFTWLFIDTFPPITFWLFWCTVLPRIYRGLKKFFEKSEEQEIPDLQKEKRERRYLNSLKRRSKRVLLRKTQRLHKHYYK